MFVARQRELAQLEAFLNRALGGQGGVCFVAGEPGSGKTTLTQEFIRRAQDAHSDLIAAIGNCNAQTGIGEAYLPFREVLGLLTGDLEAKLAQGAITVEGANRVQKVLARSGLLLLEVGPDLIGAFLPGGKIFATLGKAVAKQVGWDTKLTATVQQKPTKVALTQASVEQDHIFEQFTNFLIKFAVEHPLLIVLDDLQWVDASSMSLLFHIGVCSERSKSSWARVMKARSVPLWTRAWIASRIDWAMISGKLSPSGLAAIRFSSWSFWGICESTGSSSRTPKGSGARRQASIGRCYRREWKG
jgi:hypothetical protein